MTEDQYAAAEARHLLDWLAAHPSPGFPWLCWGYPYPWQDVGFFAPRDFPNRVVTSFVGQALIDGYETLKEPRYLDAARQAVCSSSRRRRRCSRTPAPLRQLRPGRAVDWIVMDVSALTGALAARLGSLRADAGSRRRGRSPGALCGVETDRLWRLVLRGASLGQSHLPRQLPHRIHPRRHPPYGVGAGSSEFDEPTGRASSSSAKSFRARRGCPFHERSSVPVDIHGCAQGIITTPSSTAT